LESTTLLYIVLAAFAAIIIAVFQYILKNKEKSQLKYWLSFLRFLSIFTILLLIINPSIKKNEIELIKPNLLVAVDNSTSIKYNSQERNVEKFIDKLKTDKELNNKFSINYYGFGNNLFPLDSISFNETQTNLFSPLQELSNLYKTGINPVVLISDGNQTIGNNIEFVNYKSPVFPFILGDTTQLEDISINQLNVNRFTYINNKFPVELFVNYTGKKPVSKRLSVYYKGNSVYTKQLNFSKEDNVKIESFYLTAALKGTQYYSASIEELENEKNTLNNTKNFSINVIEEQSKILILTSIIHPDLGMLKKAIESNKQRDVTVSKITDFKRNISDYQLIILYQPINSFEQVFKEISAKNLNYFIISGLSTDWEFLNEIQDNFSKNAISQAEEYHPFFNLNYASFISNDIGFSNFAPLEDIFGEVTFSIPINSLLFQKIGTIETNKPLFATFENGNQKGAILLGENSWRWRMNSFAVTKTFELFDGFISNSIQYLASKSRNSRLNVDVNPLYYANETIQFSASYLDENYNFDNRSKLWLIVNSKENNFIKKVPFALVNNSFNVEISNIPSGEYLYSVSVENQNPKTLGSFKVLPFEVEQQFTNSNDEQLKIVASKTKGQTYYNQQEIKLIANLKADNRFKIIQKSKVIETPLINWKWLLGLIILSLSIEWFVRKYFGKI
jgi:energy-coupling factor transporter transmembrane protein EcfT